MIKFLRQIRCVALLSLWRWCLGRGEDTDILIGTAEHAFLASQLWARLVGPEGALEEPPKPTFNKAAQKGSGVGRKSK